MDKPITTIEGLAALINEAMATKKAIKEFRTEVNQKFEGVESRLGGIEILLMEKQEQRMNDLERRMKKLEDGLAV